MQEIRIIPVEGIGEVAPGDDLGRLIVEAYPGIQDGDIVVVSSKAVSKAEGNIHRERDVAISPFARQVSAVTGSPPAYCELVLQESAGILRMAKGVIISRTHHGFVMANAGVDASNTGGEGLMITLPNDPDASAGVIRQSILEGTGKQVGVIVSDTFGRAWREGQMNLAIGISGVRAMRSYRGEPDDNGRVMSKTCIAAADELAAAAELASGKTGRVPAVIIRGYQVAGDGRVNDLLMDPKKDLFP